MRYILIILNIVCFGAYFISMSLRPIETKGIMLTALLIILSIFSSRYLYKKENKNRIEWALFGFLGNVNALFYHWIYRLFTDHWKKGKRVTGNN
jgi:hypothetical protein